MTFLLNETLEWNLNDFPKDFTIKWGEINCHSWEELLYNICTIRSESQLFSLAHLYFSSHRVYKYDSVYHALL